MRPCRTSIRCSTTHLNLEILDALVEPTLNSLRPRALLVANAIGTRRCAPMSISDAPSKYHNVELAPAPRPVERLVNRSVRRLVWYGSLQNFLRQRVGHQIEGVLVETIELVYALRFPACYSSSSSLLSRRMTITVSCKTFISNNSDFRSGGYGDFQPQDPAEQQHRRDPRHPRHRHERQMCQAANSNHSIGGVRTNIHLREGSSIGVCIN